MSQKVIDSHFHIWDLKNDYPWLKNLKSFSLNSNYQISDYIADFSEINVIKTVHIQAEITKEKRVYETQWLQDIADQNDQGFPNAIIGYVDFSDDKIEEDLERHCQYKNFRGIRQILKTKINDNTDLLINSKWFKNLELLNKFNLSFDLLIMFHQFDKAFNVIKKYPNTLFIINHCLWPEGTEKNLHDWKKALKKISTLDNVVIKISGFGEWLVPCNVENIKGYVLEAIDSFGINRCMFGSNFPVDKHFSKKSFKFFWNSYFEITKKLSQNEKNKIFFLNAERYYNI